MENKEKSPKLQVRLAVLIAAFCIAVFVFFYFFGSRIPENVRVMGVDVGGMNRTEARSALKDAAAAIETETMVVRLPRQTLELEPETTQIRLNLSSAINAAFDHGDPDHPDVDLQSSLRRSDDAILSRLEAYAQQYNTVYQESSFILEGQVPSLDEASVSAGSIPQTLAVTLGVPGFELDITGLHGDILKAYSTGSFLVDWQDVPPQTVPSLPDWDAIAAQYCTESTDAVFDKESASVIPATYGYAFDAEKARSLAEAAAPGETLQIPMAFVAPEKTSEDLLFQDLLGTYTSGHSDKPNIVKNLDLVCQFLNGVVIQPGEIFSFNETVGERTVERGFMYGESFTGFERSRSAGGGVCQGSSVLHVAVLEADLEVVERACHGMVVGYTPLGQDAAVSWPGPDFRFRNNTNYPIRIVAENDKNNVRIQLMGTDEKDYYIILEATQGHDDHQIYANCYKQKYSKETGQLISRELAVHSAYQYNG